jgi:large subunit ribosomal protein L3
MKRHNFAGQPASHGAKKVHRRGGAIGAHATNRGTSGRISKGKRMNGRYGNARITVRNLKLVKVDAENHLLLVCGAIPGPNGGYVMIRKTNKLG